MNKAASNYVDYICNRRRTLARLRPLQQSSNKLIAMSFTPIMWKRSP